MPVLRDPQDAETYPRPLPHYAGWVAPEVRYARDGDLSIAYQVVGARGPDLLFVPGFASHLDLAWEEPFFACFLRGLASFSRVIWFDRRGTGLSDPVAGTLTLDDMMGDVRTVLWAARSERTTLFGVAVGAAICASYAVRHPAEVQSLVLWGGHARLVRDAGYPAGWRVFIFGVGLPAGQVGGSSALMMPL